jgi:hypothetical protein
MMAAMAAIRFQVIDAPLLTILQDPEPAGWPCAGSATSSMRRPPRSRRPSISRRRPGPHGLSAALDLDQKRLAGNFPQAFSHVGLINTAMNLSSWQAPATERAER